MDDVSSSLLFKYSDRGEETCHFCSILNPLKKSVIS